MKSCPGISVIVVTYNQQDTLGRTLDSILAQRECGPYEVLVSDDCSADATADVAREYARRFPGIVKVHVNERNLGVQRNYFDTMRRAGYDYIADCAGDDWWCDPLKLRKEREILDANSGVAVVHTGFRLAYPDRREDFRPRTSVREGTVAGRRALEAILCSDDTPFMHLCSALYRKAPVLRSLDEHPEEFLDPAFRCEDLQVMCALAAAGDVAYLPEPTLCYSVGHSSISSVENYEKAFDFYFATTRLRLMLMKRYGIAGPMAADALRRLTGYLMAQAFHAGTRDRAEALLQWMATEGVSPSAKIQFYRLTWNAGMRRMASRLLLLRHKDENR